MTKKKQGMDEDALGGLFDSIDLVYEDDLPEAQAEESQAQATDAAPAVPAAVAEEVAEGTNEAPSEEASGETPDETSEEEAEAAEDAEASDETDEASGEVAPGSGFDPVSAAMTGDEEEEGQLTLARYASRAYLEYAMSVVKSRALPDVSDGQKPVQRRILIDMYKMGLSAGKKPVKSARVVGDVLGKYHPHGDQSVYDALVRMAQNFSLRYPLIDGKGNFGSRDGDSQAAMRYTEARLMPIAELLLDEVESGAVDFVPNYDGNFREPVELPAKLPFVLLNGSSGIAVGRATSIPSHNLRETAEAVKLLLEKPEATLEEVLEKLPGPDFPCGGQIISSPDVIRDTYRTGRGKITVRARYHFEEMARGQWQLVFDELPPEASSASVLSEIDDITNPKVPKGKKSLSPKQIQAKTALLALLDRARDESGRDVPVRLVFEPRTSRVNREEFVSALLSQTKLESNVSVNLVMLGIDGKPRQKGLMEILGEWVSFRLNAVRRRSQARLDDVNDRLHVLEGRRLILLNIDRVIEIIRHADEPKKALMEAFPLSDRQAEDILEMRLRQIAKLAAIAIEKEIDELETERRKLERLLGSEALLRRQVAREVDDAVKKFGDDRRTLIEEARVAQNEATVPSSPVTVIITEKGFLTTRSGHDYDLSALNLRVGDAVLKTIECRTTDSICALSQTGRSYTIAVSALPGGRSASAGLREQSHVGGANLSARRLNWPAVQFWGYAPSRVGYTIGWQGRHAHGPRRRREASHGHGRQRPRSSRARHGPRRQGPRTAPRTPRDRRLHRQARPQGEDSAAYLEGRSRRGGGGRPRTRGADRRGPQDRNLRRSGTQTLLTNRHATNSPRLHESFDATSASHAFVGELHRRVGGLHDASQLGARSERRHGANRGGTAPSRLPLRLSRA